MTFNKFSIRKIVSQSCECFSDFRPLILRCCGLQLVPKCQRLNFSLPGRRDLCRDCLFLLILLGQSIEISLGDRGSRRITGDDGLLDLRGLDNLLDSTVKLFAFTHVSNTLGTVNPVADLCERARKLRSATGGQDYVI